MPDGSAIKKCYVLTSRATQWKSDFTLSLMKPRAFAGALVTRRPTTTAGGPGRLGWWLTGGVNSHGTRHATTELFDDFEFISGPNLPQAMSHHCLVHLAQAERSIVIGGQTGNNNEELSQVCT